MNEKADVIVIGGGAAGLMAAGTAALRGKKVVLIEKNHILGKKLLITGKGRCNITNACEDVETLLENVTVNRSFLYSAFYGFTNDDTIKFFNTLGVENIKKGFLIPIKAPAEPIEPLLEYCGCSVSSPITL